MMALCLFTADKLKRGALGKHALLHADESDLDAARDTALAADQNRGHHPAPACRPRRSAATAFRWTCPTIRSP
jgi:hypothetical protein